MSKDPYQTLNIHPNAKIEEIKKAYRELVKIHHPDKGGDQKLMLEINAAWESLKKKHNDINSNKSNNYSVYKKNEFKKEIPNHSESENIKNWFQNIFRF